MPCLAKITVVSRSAFFALILVARVVFLVAFAFLIHRVAVVIASFHGVAGFVAQKWALESLERFGNSGLGALSAEVVVEVAETLKEFDPLAS